MNRLHLHSPPSTGLGSQILIVGGSIYPATVTGLQAAINSVLAEIQFTETAYAGETVAITKDTKLVTGTGTNWTTDFPGTNDMGNDQFMSMTGGATRKWYRIQEVIDDTHMLLYTPFTETTIIGEDYQTGAPVMHHIHIVENMHLDVTNEIIYFTDDGTVAGNGIEAIALTISFGQGVTFGAQVELDINSGILVIDGLTTINPQRARFSGVNGGPSTPATDSSALLVTMKNVDYDSYAGLINNVGDYFGEFVLQGRIKGRHVAPVPAAHNVTIRDAFITSFASYDSLAQDNSAIEVNVEKNSIATVTNSHLILSVDLSVNNDVYGIVFHAYPTLLAAGHQENVTVKIDNTLIELTKDGDATQNAGIDLQAVHLDDLSGGNLYIRNSVFKIIGDPLDSIVAAEVVWRNIGLTNSGVQANKVDVHVINSVMLDLPNDWTKLDLVELVGDMGDKDTFAAATPTSAEIDPLRASRFHISLTAAMTIPAPAIVAPAGHRWSFHFTQDAGGTNAVTFNAAFNTKAGYDAGGASGGNEQTVIEFMSDGTSYYQINDNEWI